MPGEREESEEKRYAEYRPLRFSLLALLATVTFSASVLVPQLTIEGT